MTTISVNYILQDYIQIIINPGTFQDNINMVFKITFTEQHKKCGLVSASCRPGKGSVCKLPCPDKMFVSKFLLDEHLKEQTTLIKLLTTKTK